MGDAPFKNSVLMGKHFALQESYCLHLQLVFSLTLNFVTCVLFPKIQALPTTNSNYNNILLPVNELMLFVVESKFVTHR